jgi:NAD(P)-dependent dehydrogenase (short-subunit alcohol dehydrogenase family)
MAAVENNASRIETRLDGRVALVTGAARGLGRTMAQALVRAGAAVAFADLDNPEPAMVEVAGKPGSGKVIALTCDITREADCARAVATTIEALGGLTILVNNAGKGPVHVEASPRTKSLKFWEADPDIWQQVIVTNVNGTFLMSRQAVPSMIAAGWGRIINVTTSLGTMQRKQNSPYGVSKAAIEAETLIWSKDLEGTGVTVNSLIPGGAVDTDFVSSEARRSGRPLLQTPVMIAPLLWLASNAADGVTGGRFVGKNWDAGLPPEAAARGARDAPVLLPPTDGR